MKRTSARSASSAWSAGGGICDNMKTAVSTVFVGKKRDYNRRFQEMCSHHLVEPVARPRAPEPVNDFETVTIAIY